MNDLTRYSDLLEADQPVTCIDLINNILPVRDQPYSLDEIDANLRAFKSSIENIQESSNQSFKTVLDKATSEKLCNIYNGLESTQLDVIKLQCDISKTRESFVAIKPICDNPLIRERRDMIVLERRLREQLQQMKFEPVKKFFEKFVDYLCTSVANCRKLFFYQSSNYSQAFEWTHYHHIMYLLQACGKTISDIERVERLFIDDSRLNSLIFKQQIEKMDFNNFIQFPNLFSIESQLEIVDDKSQRLSFDQYISTHLDNILTPARGEPSSHSEYLSAVTQRLRTVTSDCCGLMVELNLNYIEALFTDGINIDRLNGHETGSGQQATGGVEETLPYYAFSPQEYITQIGQHLLTLRKQTEQFDTPANEPLKIGLQFLEQEQKVQMDIASCKSVTETVLKCIARHCIRSLLGRTGSSILTKLTSNGKRQLITDALYLDNVLEDLSLLDADEPYVEKFKNLLKQ